MGIIPLTNVEKKDHSIMMIAYKKYSVEEVLSAMDVPASYRRSKLPDGTTFKCKSDRLVLFRDKGVICVSCGIVGNIFILETHSPEIAPHLNLYATNDEDKLVLMTKDHIVPKSKGGANSLDNYQPMCTRCNGKKADKMTE